MIDFEYTMNDEFGIHARPAGILGREAKKFKSKITFSFGTRTADATALFAMMKLGAKKGNVLAVEAEGEDEQAAAAAIKHLLQSVNL